MTIKKKGDKPHMKSLAETGSDGTYTQVDCADAEAASPTASVENSDSLCVMGLWLYIV